MMSSLTVAEADRLSVIRATFKRSFIQPKSLKLTAPVEVPIVKGMEASVRYIAHSNDVGVKPALCFRGLKWAHCIINEDEGIRVTKVDVRTFDTSVQVEFQGAAYPIKRAAEQLIAFTRRHTARKEITQAARELIDRVLANEVIEDVPEVKAKQVEGVTKSTILGLICSELKVEPTAARRLLRKAGMCAPYNDEAAIRNALQK